MVISSEELSKPIDPRTAYEKRVDALERRLNLLWSSFIVNLSDENTKETMKSLWKEEGDPFKR